MLDALSLTVLAGVPIVGLEPACLLTLRDEFPALLPGEETEALAARAQLFEEFVASEKADGRFLLQHAAMPGQTALLHGHCHQKAFDAMGAVEGVLKLIPQLAVETVESSCCGMAGALGMEAEHYDLSMKIGELGVPPRCAPPRPDTLIAACAATATRSPRAPAATPRHRADTG